MMRNWWYYHKWYVICGFVLVFAVIDIVGAGLGWFQDVPDIQIAYIGERPLSEDMAASLEDSFASLAEDYNRDGKVLVKINQFASGDRLDSAESLSYQQAVEIALMGDIESCTSYFFLMEDPGKVQREFQVLAMPDGSCPDACDYSVEGKVIPWEPGFYLGRRCFYHEKRTPYADECGKIWDTLQKKGREVGIE